MKTYMKAVCSKSSRLVASHHASHVSYVFSRMLTARKVGESLKNIKALCTLKTPSRVRSLTEWVKRKSHCDSCKEELLRRRQASALDEARQMSRNVEHADVAV